MIDDGAQVYEVSQTSRIEQISPNVTIKYITRTFSDGFQVVDTIKVTKALTKSGLIRITPEYTYNAYADTTGKKTATVTIYGTFTYDGNTASCVSKYYESKTLVGKFTAQSIRMKNNVTSGRKPTISYTGTILVGRVNKYIDVNLWCDRNGKWDGNGNTRAS